MKVAAVQIDLKILDRDHNLNEVLRRFKEAAEAGASLVVFPECALTGYCFSSSAEAMEVAETVPGPSTEKIRAEAKKLDATAVVGMLEQLGDRLYNAAAVITPDGTLGTFRKVHLLHLGIDRYDDPGDKPFPVFETPFAKVGVNICFDCSFPESGRMVKLRGGQVLAIPTNWPVGSDVWQHTPKARAAENHFYVIAANRVGEERGFRFVGHSQIISFTGEVLAEAGESEETILYAEIDPLSADDNRVVRVPGEYEFDRMASRRPEMYPLLTETRRARRR